MAPHQALLAVDVGNSTTVVASFDLTAGEFTWVRRFTSVRDRTSDEWRAILNAAGPELATIVPHLTGCCLSSVVPSITRALVPALRDWLSVEPLVVTHDLDLGIAVAVDHPAEVGTDRLVNAVAAAALAGTPTIVVDAGTATKVDAVSGEAAFLGGVIAPGMGIGLEALASRAARLFAVDLAMPARAIGRNTIDAIRSGVVLGHLAMIEGLIARERDELGCDAPVVVTGGYGALLAGASPLLREWQPNLTLAGIVDVWRRNVNSRTARSGELPDRSTNL